MTDADQLAAIKQLVEKHKAKHTDKNEDLSQPEEESKAKKVKEMIFEGGDQEDIKQLDTETTFAELGVCPEICNAIEKMGF